MIRRGDKRPAGGEYSEEEGRYADQSDPPAIQR